MAAYLVDLSTGRRLGEASCLNPQRAFGGDVISRADHAANAEGLNELQSLVAGAIGELVRKLTRDVSSVRHVVCVGNTIMMHLLAGITPKHIAVLPFAPAYSRRWDVPATDLDIALPNAMVTLGPCVAGYVGADTVAAILACDMDKSDGLSLLIDIGTNGEIALGGAGGIACCSAAAGPAFEGAHIACGSGAAAGAIDSVRLAEGKVEVTALGGAEARSICGSGLVDAVAQFKRNGVMDETGRLDEDEAPDEYARHFTDVDGKPAFRLTERVYVTQRDLREVQLAKAAIAAGVDVLLDDAGARMEDVKALYLAGGFGNYIDRESGVEIGLLPEQLKGRIVPVGNAAGAGARRMLIRRDAAARAEEIARNARYIELSARSDFQDRFVDRMMF